MDRTKFDYREVNLIPRKCIVDSRSEITTDVIFGKHTFKMPIVPANMSSVINPELAEKLAENGHFYIMHRFLTDEQIMSFVKNMNSKNLITSISVGVKDKDKFIVDQLIDNQLNVDYFTIDIAHGHAESVKNMIAYIKSRYSNTFIIAGNVASEQGIVDLQHWGADAIKVGVAPGKACTTAFMTGFGSRNCQASTVMECARVAKVPIIADGGIEFPGDIAVALTMGATLIMTGALLAGCTDSPGELKFINNEYIKEYWGSASQHESGKANRIEGTMKLIPYKNKTLLEQYNFLQECLQSSISYGGGNSLEVFNYVRWK